MCYHISYIYRAHLASVDQVLPRSAKVKIIVRYTLKTDNYLDLTRPWCPTLNCRTCVCVLLPLKISVDQSIRQYDLKKHFLHTRLSWSPMWFMTWGSLTDIYWVWMTTALFTFRCNIPDPPIRVVSRLVTDIVVYYSGENETRTRGEEVKRCRCCERQRTKAW